jgi:phage protein D
MARLSYTIFINTAPADPDLLAAVQEVQVESHCDLAAVFRLRLAIGLSPKGDWTILEDDPFQPLTPVKITLQVGTGLGETLINGYVTSQRLEIGNEPGQSYLEVVGMDSTVLMNVEEKTVAWPNMADSDIAAAIFGNYGLTPRIEQTQPIRQETDLTTIQRGSDIRFLQQLADRNGFECYVETDPLLNTEVGHFHPPELQSMPQGPLSVNFGAQTNLRSFSARYEMLKPSAAQSAGIDISTKSVQKGQVRSVSANRLGREGLLDRISKQPLVLPARTGLTGTAELQTFCQAAVDRSALAMVAEGEVDSAAYESILRTRRTVNVRGAGSLYSGTYYVTRVLHRLSQERCTQHFELRRNAIGLTGTEVFI